jgi:hypothetical protein
MIRPIGCLTSLLMLLLLLHLPAISCFGGSVTTGFPYMYATERNPNASYPVIDHIAPEDRRERDVQKPAFLYDPNQGYRIVNFYGHWCNICKNFKPHYIHFAKRVQELAKAHNVTVSVYAISCHPNRRLCRNQKTRGYPLVRLLAPGQTEGFDMTHSEISPVKVLRKMGLEIKDEEAEEDWDVVVPPEYEEYPTIFHRFFDLIQGNEQFHRVHQRRTREELKADIHMSFDFAMRDAIFTSNEALAPEPKKALNAWLKLLYKTIPTSWELHKLLNQLLKDFNYITKSEHYMYQILDTFPPPSKTWSRACSKNERDQGYTCGLWSLLHAVTVGLVNYNFDANENRRIAPKDAAKTIRDYLDHFFHCSECRINFLKMYDTCGYNHCARLVESTKGTIPTQLPSWIELPMWLFEVHNGVNVRLMKEKAGRMGITPSKEDETNALWPPKTECLACWNTKGRTDKQPWNTTNVYKWLQLEYGQKNSDTAKIRKELTAMAEIVQKKEKRKARRIEITNGSLAMMGFASMLIGLRVKRRRSYGRRKKHEDHGGDEMPSLRPPRNKRYAK